MAESASEVPGRPRSANCAEATLGEDQLEVWAGELGRVAVDSRLFVALYGPLGAGKSTLVRAACRGVGVAGPIPSPTFTLVNRYATPDGEAIGHVDLYRINGVSELLGLGWDEMLEAGDALFVEWAERAEGFLPDRRWDIVLGIGADPTTRTVSLTPRGSAPVPPPLPTGSSC